MTIEVRTIGTAGDYVTVLDFLQSTAGDLVTSGLIIVGELIDNKQYDEDVLIFTGATVDASNYRVLRAASGIAHNGQSGTGPRIYSDVGSFGAVLNVDENFVRIENVEVESDGLGVMYGIFQNATGTDLQVSGVIVSKCHYGGMFIQNSGTVYNSTLIYCGVYDGALGAIQGDSGDTGQVLVVNCTAIRDELDEARSVTGFRYVTVRDSLVFNYGGSAGHQDYLNVGANSTNYGASDANGSSPALSNLSASGELVATASGTGANLNLSHSTTVANSGAATLSEDIQGNPRSADVSDMGAYEYSMSGGTAVFMGDPKLSFLTRFESYLTGDEQVDNITDSVTFAGLSTFQISGVISSHSVEARPSILPSGSGAVLDSSSEIFHLHPTSGNQSGFGTSTSTPFSFGFFGRPTEEFLNDRSWFGRWASTSDGRHQLLHLSSGGINNFNWELFLGGAGGDSSTLVGMTTPIEMGRWQSVVATVNPAASTAILYCSGIPVASSISLSYDPGESGLGIDVPIRLGSHRSSTSNSVVNAIGIEQGSLAEPFFIQRYLSEAEVIGYSVSGFIAGTPEVDVTPEGVLADDANLVALYRYNDGPYASGTTFMRNQSAAPAYTGSNDMVSSGRFDGAEDVGIKDDGPPEAPLSSGQWFGSGIFTDGFPLGDFFDLSAISGEGGPTTPDMSGMSATSGDSLSIGTWVKVSGWDESDEIVFVSRSTDFGGDDGYFFTLGKQFNNITKNQEFFFQFGTESGADSEFVESLPSNVSGVWQHVVGVVDSDTATAKIFLDGVDVTADSSPEPKVYAPAGSGSAFDLLIPVRLGVQTYDPTDLWTTGNFGLLSSGWMAETFIMNRALSDAEVLGIHNSGFIVQTFNSESDTNDTQKDNVGEIAAPDGPRLVMTAWNPRQQANPSGMRQITSGVHPAFVKLLGEDAVSGLLFPGAMQGTPSEPVAVSVRAETNGKLVESMNIWISDDSAFTGVDGFEVAGVVASEWLPNIVIPSGSGVVGRNLADALLVLRSDKNTTISGLQVNDQSASGEAGVDISQYIYMSFDTNNDFEPGTYGPTGFQFRVSISFQDV